MCVRACVFMCVCRQKPIPNTHQRHGGGGSISDLSSTSIPHLIPRPTSVGKYSLSFCLSTAKSRFLTFLLGGGVGEVVDARVGGRGGGGEGLSG